jgi:PhnB protein
VYTPGVGRAPFFGNQAGQGCPPLAFGKGSLAEHALADQLRKRQYRYLVNFSYQTPYTMATLNPYLNFMGTTEQAFLFYKSVFGGEFLGLQRFKDTPEADRLPAADQEKIMHVALPIGNGNMLMGTDTLESMGHQLTQGNNFYLSISADSIAEADRLFEGLSAGGTVSMPMEKAFWGDYFGMCTDPFGVQWMISYALAQDGQATAAKKGAEAKL